MHYLWGRPWQQRWSAVGGAGSAEGLSQRKAGERRTQGYAFDFVKKSITIPFSYSGRRKRQIAAVCEWRTLLLTLQIL